MAVKRKQTNEDMKILLELGDGYTAGTPWRAEFYTSQQRQYVCSYDGTKYTNAVQVSTGKVLCLLDNHQLGTGMLNVRLLIMLADAQMQDGAYTLAYNGMVHYTETVGTGAEATTKTYNIELVYKNSDKWPETPQVTFDMLSTVLKGEKGDKGDDGNVDFDSITESQLAQITKPALDKLQEWKDAGLLKGDKGDTGNVDFNQLSESQISQLTTPAIEKMTEWKNAGQLKGDASIVAVEINSEGHLLISQSEDVADFTISNQHLIMTI